jgi:2-methylcitrate dehydratase PrpD
MVKRLHLGRAAESGVLAAQLAAHGYDGPRTILEGEFGVLSSFCSKSDPERLTARLGTFFETSLLCIKPYACHVTAQAPIELLRALMAEHGFAARDIAAIEVAASEKVASHHGEQRPADVMLGQYSVPFSLAVAAWRDPADPTSFADDCIHDAGILDLAARIKIVPGESGWGAGLAIALRDGRKLSGTIKSFRGCPETPMSLDDIAAKFRRLTRGKPGMDALLEALLDIENVGDVAALRL